MKNTDFETFVVKERERLTTLKEDLTKKIEELKEELNTASRSLMGLDAYQAAKEGKLPEVKAPRAPRATGTRAPRDTSMRTQVLLAITKLKPVKRNQLIQELGIKGDKKKEQNLSNMLVNMKKAGLITHGDDGTYSTGGMAISTT